MTLITANELSNAQYHATDAISSYRRKDGSFKISGTLEGQGLQIQHHV